MDQEQLKELQDIISHGSSMLQNYMGNYEHNKQTYTERECYDAAKRKQTSNRMLQKAFQYAAVDNLYKSLYYSNKAIRFNPDNIDARVTRGAVYAKLGEMNNAFIDGKDSLMLNPLHHEAKVLMSNLLVYFSKQHIYRNRCFLWLDSLLLAKKYNPSNPAVDVLLSIGEHRVCISSDCDQPKDEFSPPSLKRVAIVYDQLFSEADAIRIREKYNEAERMQKAVAHISSTPSTSRTSPN